MRIGFIEPHMKRVGGIRRVVELGNHLVNLGHRVTYFVPPNVEPHCDWIQCAGAIKHLKSRNDDDLDFLIYNNEPDWHYLDSFPNAAKKCFFALHFAQLYEKEGSWECLHKDVDLFLANSEWTAEQIETAIGIRPETFAGGLSRDHFHPVDIPKEYPLLSVGDKRPWKGHDVVEAAAAALQTRLETYAGKNLSQDQMAAEYSKAEVFVVGSDFEGFGQPGLEALACGTPLVTTDNGGCREYAINEETALVVPPRDSEAMARAIERLRSDPELAGRLRRQGLALVRDRFDWATSAAELERILVRALGGEIDHRRGPGTLLRSVPSSPLLTLVVYSDDLLQRTERCVTSLRLHTDVPYELIIAVDGSGPIVSSYSAQAADKAIVDGSTKGLAVRMREGLDAAEGEYVAFVRSDARLPEKWAGAVLSGFTRCPEAGLIIPGRQGRTQTDEASGRNGVELLHAFGALPRSGVWVMPKALAEELGAFDSEPTTAGWEHYDAAFRVWLNNLAVCVDPQVEVSYAGSTSAGSHGIGADERTAASRFAAQWTDLEFQPPRLGHCDEDAWRRNRSAAAGAASWISRYAVAAEELKHAQTDCRAMEQQLLSRERKAVQSGRQRYEELRRRRSVRMALASSELIRIAWEKLASIARPARGESDEVRSDRD